MEVESSVISEVLFLWPRRRKGELITKYYASIPLIYLLRKERERRLKRKGGLFTVFRFTKNIKASEK